MDQLETEALALITLTRHSEDWSSEYTKDPVTHIRLLRTEAKLQVNLTKYFRDIAQDAVRYLHWNAYVNQNRQTFAQQPSFNVEVIVQDVPMEQYDGTFIKIVFEEVATLIATGAAAGEAIYNVPLGIQSTDAIIQQLTKKHIASLVGKKVAKDGSIVDNPSATYRISDKTRKDIVESIKTSLNLGEDVPTATARIQKVIANPNRAKVIAQTESVNAYQQGLEEFGRQSGAVGKESQDVGAVDRCRDYAALGPVPFDYLYDGIYSGPTYHTRCRCGRRLVYAEEWQRIQAAQATP